MELSEAFGKVLKQRRVAAKLSQEKFAELCEIERTYVSFLERGLRQPSLDMTFRISKAFGISASELVQEVEAQLAS